MTGSDEYFQGLSSISWNAVEPGPLSRRFGQIFNSMYLAQFLTTIAERTLLSVSQVIGDQKNYPFQYYSYQFITGSAQTSTTVYQANKIWVTLLIAVSIILLLCVLLSLVFRLDIMVPDILGYVSSLTRDNPYVDSGLVGPVGSLLDGIDRTRRLKDIRLQIVDVAPESDVGHVAVVEIGKQMDTENRISGAQEEAAPSGTSSRLDTWYS